jgi:hypothetical protein
MANIILIQYGRINNQFFVLSKTYQLHQKSGHYLLLRPHNLHHRWLFIPLYIPFFAKPGIFVYHETNDGTFGISLQDEVFGKTQSGTWKF